MNRKKTVVGVVVALVLALLLAVVNVLGSSTTQAAPFSFDKVQRVASVTEKDAPKVHNRGFTPKVGEAPAEFLQDNPPVVRSRKATQADVDSGFAASLAATVYLCSQGITIRNPVTDAFDSDYAVYVGWEESTSSGGVAMARINVGNAIFVKNNDAVDIFWSSATWSNSYGFYKQIQYNWTTWKYVQTYLNVVAKNGGQLGIKVNSLGDADPTNPANAWKTADHNGAGFRNYISNSVNASYLNETPNQPVLGITTYGSGSNASQNTNTLVGIEATNNAPCGYLVD